MSNATSSSRKATVGRADLSSTRASGEHTMTWVACRQPDNELSMMAIKAEIGVLTHRCVGAGKQAVGEHAHHITRNSGRQFLPIATSG